MSLRNTISRLVAHLQHVRMGRPEYAIYFGYGIGDDLLCTALARELKKRGAGKIVMFSKHPSLFDSNADFSAVYDRKFATIGRRWHAGYKGIVPHYSTIDSTGDVDVFNNEHIITTMCRIAALTGTIEIKPYLNLQAHEIDTARHFENQAVIQSSGLAVGSGVMLNKNWFPERFQEVSDAMGGSLRMIQLGQMTDPPIRGALDLRGKTTLRESAAILATSRIFIGQVGFLMHLARSVDCRSVIVYGGRELPSVSGYLANENVVGRTPCSPCGQRNKCDYHRECMRLIGVAEVVAAIKRQLVRVGTPLEVEQVDLNASKERAA